MGLGLARQPSAGRGDQVLLLDREAGELVETAFTPHQRDVGAVQGTSELDVVPSLAARSTALAQYFTGLPGGGGVRNGIVAVDDLDVVLLHYFDQLIGQVERVRRVTEQRVVADIDRMETQIGQRPVEPEGHVV